MILLNYRTAVPANFAEGSTILMTLPRYSPLPGHTPEPVVLSGSYDVETGLSNLSWSESTDSSLKEYEVRAVAGPDNETVGGNIPPGAPLSWSGAFFGLGVPGAG